MPRKHHKPEEIVAKLRQVDVLTSQGKSVADAIRAIGVTEMTYYPWRQERLTADIVELARRHGRLGYRKIAEMLRSTAGWIVNDKRVERIWRREGLKVSAKQSKQGRIWLADGSCIRLRASALYANRRSKRGHRGSPSRIGPTCIAN